MGLTPRQVDELTFSEMLVISKAFAAAKAGEAPSPEAPSADEFLAAVAADQQRRRG